MPVSNSLDKRKFIICVCVLGKFGDCTPIQEEHCAVLETLEEGNLSILLYESYQALRGGGRRI
jgi:putative ribosome biogenesis GTPase RsgA